jgi:hypothetical protein
MNTFDLTTLLQLGPLAVVLIYIIMRLERAMGALALGLGQMNRILLLLLRKSGVEDEEALALCAGARCRREEGR